MKIIEQIRQLSFPPFDRLWIHIENQPFNGLCVLDGNISHSLIRFQILKCVVSGLLFFVDGFFRKVSHPFHITQASFSFLEAWPLFRLEVLDAVKILRLISKLVVGRRSAMLLRNELISIFLGDSFVRDGYFLV